jgi:hypothetical protein
MHRQAMLRKNPSEVKLEKPVVQSEETLRSREQDRKKRREQEELAEKLIKQDKERKQRKLDEKVQR